MAACHRPRFGSSPPAHDPDSPMVPPHARSLRAPVPTITPEASPS
jgi:hypothetical protein